MSHEGAIAAMRGAAGCEDCFETNSNLYRALCDTPQPRWIGKRYFDASRRVVVVLINPGGGGSSANPALSQEADFFRQFYRTGNYDAVRSYFKKQMDQGARWWNWYRDVLGLKHDEIAQINVAWCPTRDNEYPPAMLRHCFAKHTASLLLCLNPDLVLLSGSATHRFASDVSKALPAARVLQTLHYAHRKSKVEEATEAERIRRLIAGMKRQGPATQG